MKKPCVSGVLILALIWICVPAVSQAQKLVYLVRHAERADSRARGMQREANPPLSAAGQKRAAELGEMLKDAGIKAIYVTEFLRTQETAKPLAARLGLAPALVPSTNTDELIQKMRKQHPDDIVLIVGHSNTVPGIIKALGGPEVVIPDNEFDNLFIVVPATRTMSRIRFRP
jgi:broad specificity phosphatase PhoE